MSTGGLANVAAVGDRLLVIVDADTLAGWRRVTSSLDQLHAAVGDLRDQAPEAQVAVIGDPSLKWALPEAEREAVETDIVTGALVFAPAGCNGGHRAFMARVAERARQKGFSPVAVTDQVIPDCRIARVRRDGPRWVFDLDGASAPAVTAAVPAGDGRRRRRRS